jgi:arginine/ornithine N-succinyltransferase beta subunit
MEINKSLLNKEFYQSNNYISIFDKNGNPLKIV